MASTTTTRLGLFKPTPGTNEPFRITDINDNYDLIDTFSEEYDTEYAALEARVTTSENEIATLQPMTLETVTGTARTLVAADSNKLLRCANTLVLTFTIADVFAIGQTVNILMDGAQVTFTEGAGVTLHSSLEYRNTFRQYGWTTLSKVAAGEYRLNGNLTE